MNNENEEHTLIKISKFLDGKLKSWSGLTGPLDTSKIVSRSRCRTLR